MGPESPNDIPIERLNHEEAMHFQQLIFDLVDSREEDDIWMGAHYLPDGRSVTTVYYALPAEISCEVTIRGLPERDKSGLPYCYGNRYVLREDLRFEQHPIFERGVAPFYPECEAAETDPFLNPHERLRSSIREVENAVLRTNGHSFIADMNVVARRRIPGYETMMERFLPRYIDENRDAPEVIEMFQAFMAVPLEQEHDEVLLLETASRLGLDEIEDPSGEVEAALDRVSEAWENAEQARRLSEAGGLYAPMRGEFETLTEQLKSIPSRQSASRKD